MTVLSLLNDILETAKAEKGLFLSERFHPIFKYYRKDNNIFFTASILHTIQRHKGLLNEKELAVKDEIVALCGQSYKAYKNLDGLPFFNFYSLNPINHFPGSNWIGKFKFFKLADDLDDTALVISAFKETASLAHSFHKLVAEHTNHSKGIIKYPIKGAAHLKTYSTWLGTKMPIEFDVGVLCNYLYMVHLFRIEPNKYDEDAVEFLILVIKNNWHLKSPHRVCPEYPSAALIIYHLARLMNKFEITRLEIYREKLIKDAHIVYAKAKSPMDLLIIESALLMLGGKAKGITSPVIKNRFGFFTASFLNIFKNPFIRPIASSKLFHMQYHCEAFNKALMLENLLLKRQN